MGDMVYNILQHNIVKSHAPSLFLKTFLRH